MFQKPRLKKYLTVFPISETTWGLRGGSEELWRIQLSDERAIRALGALLPYLNGRHEVQEILDQVAAQGVEAEVASKLLEKLEKMSFLEEVDASGLSPEEMERHGDQLTFFSRFSLGGGASLQASLRECRIAVVGDSPLSRRLRLDLKVAGFDDMLRLTSDPGSAGSNGSSAEHEDVLLDRKTIWPAGSEAELPRLIVVPLAAHDPELLEAMDELSRSRGVPWLLLRTIDPQEGWVGPLFVPGDTASYRSLEARLRGNTEHFEEYLAFDKFVRGSSDGAASSGGLAAHLAVLSGIAVSEIVKYVSGYAIPQLAGRFITVHYMTWDMEVHEVLRVPHLEMDTQSRPRVFPWKEIPYGEKKTRRA